MSEIRITSIPSGLAPEEVRKQWVGLVLPIEDDDEASQKITTAIFGAPLPPGGRGVYLVRTNSALGILAAKSPTAIKWYLTNTNLNGTPNLAFSKDNCELVN